MNYQPSIPEGLWRKPLFANAAVFRTPGVELAAEEIDARLRRIRGMPSTADGTQAKTMEGLAAITCVAERWLSMKRPECRDSMPVPHDFLEARRLVAAGYPRTETIGFLTGASARIPAAWRESVSRDDLSDDQVAALLDYVASVDLDRYMRASPLFRKQYLKRIYRVADHALMFNTTTDLRRLAPVLAWIRHLLVLEKKSGCSYVDVGCAMSEGAPALLLAAKALRLDGICRELHGTDVVRPDPAFARDMLGKHRILVYASQPVIRPLPRAYDVILLANVIRHLSPDLQKNLVSNLAASLRENGMLFINWRFDAKNNQCLCLKRKEARMLLHSEGNLI